MKGKKVLVLVLSCMMLLGCLSVSTTAAQQEGTGDIAIMATNRFNTIVPANTAIQTGYGFSLVAGESVTIKATYTPFSASVDFGLVAPDGLFYGINTNNGTFDETIGVDQNGVYTLVIFNRSSVAINVSGYVNY